MKIEFDVIMHIADRSMLFQHAGEVAGRPATSIEEAIALAMINPATAPKRTGFSIYPGQISVRPHLHGHHQPLPTYLLHVAAEVTDEAAVITEARQRYADCWYDHSWAPGSIEEAVYEILVASNASPSPIECGFEIVDSAYPKGTHRIAA